MKDLKAKINARESLIERTKDAIKRNEDSVLEVTRKIEEAITNQQESQAIKLQQQLTSLQGERLAAAEVLRTIENKEPFSHDELKKHWAMRREQITKELEKESGKVEKCIEALRFAFDSYSNLLGGYNPEVKEWRLLFQHTDAFKIMPPSGSRRAFDASLPANKMITETEEYLRELMR